MRYIIPGVLILLIVVSALHVTRRRPAFVIRVKDGQPHVMKGKVTGRFLVDCREVLEASSTTSGTITGFSGQAGTRLEFSREITALDQQRIRNLWHLAT